MFSLLGMATYIQHSGAKGKKMAGCRFDGSLVYTMSYKRRPCLKNNDSTLNQIPSGVMQMCICSIENKKDMNTRKCFYT